MELMYTNKIKKVVVCWCSQQLVYESTRSSGGPGHEENERYSFDSDGVLWSLGGKDIHRLFAKVFRTSY